MLGPCKVKLTETRTTPNSIPKMPQKVLQKVPQKRAPISVPKKCPKNAPKSVPKSAPKSAQKSVSKNAPKSTQKRAPKSVPKSAQKKCPKKVPKKGPQKITLKNTYLQINFTNFHHLKTPNQIILTHFFPINPFISYHNITLQPKITLIPNLTLHQPPIFLNIKT